MGILRRNSFTCPRRNELFAYGAGVQNADNWGRDETCSYCGSLSPKALFEAIEVGDKIVPTDKNYKIYVGDRRKFYFQHLGKEEKVRFIDLHNEGRLNMGYPGHFYVTPYFCKLSSEMYKTWEEAES